MQKLEWELPGPFRDTLTLLDTLDAQACVHHRGIDDWFDRMSMLGTFGDSNTIIAAALLFNVRIHVVVASLTPPVYVVECPEHLEARWQPTASIWLACIPDVHFMSAPLLPASQPAPYIRQLEAGKHQRSYPIPPTPTGKMPPPMSMNHRKLPSPPPKDKQSLSLRPSPPKAKPPVPPNLPTMPVAAPILPTMPVAAPILPTMPVPPTPSVSLPPAILLSAKRSHPSLANSTENQSQSSPALKFFASPASSISTKTVSSSSSSEGKGKYLRSDDKGRRCAHRHRVLAMVQDVESGAVLATDSCAPCGCPNQGRCCKMLTIIIAECALSSSLGNTVMDLKKDSTDDDWEAITRCHQMNKDLFSEALKMVQRTADGKVVGSYYQLEGIRVCWATWGYIKCDLPCIITHSSLHIPLHTSSVFISSAHLLFIAPLRTSCSCPCCRGATKETMKVIHRRLMAGHREWSSSTA